MNPNAMQALLNVLAMTPDPPPGEVDPNDVIARAREMADAREEPLTHLKKMMANDSKVSGEGAAILDEIRLRDSRWHAALERARHELSQRMNAARHIRRRVPSSIP